MVASIAEELQTAARQLARRDPVLKPVIARAGPCTITPHTDYYWELIDSIISQQLSVKAAASIERRFQELLGSPVPSPEAILAKSVDELRTAGLSNAKARYIRDLAQHIVDGVVRFDRLDQQSNEEIIGELTAVKGIGEWTAHMFLIFCMGRLDVLPVGDLGIRNGVRKLYGLAELPSPQKIRDIAVRNGWAPYESVASWYVWQSLDNLPAV
ncbi:MAG TPA: DNA-3-methyladenine glycosylase [Candidatus Saccharimonadales bacterium]|nr:DNA-3-methyladenine glycosylase [Candidatus Saccharimonadales bacterium]